MFSVIHISRSTQNQRTTSFDFIPVMWKLAQMVVK